MNKQIPSHIIPFLKWPGGKRWLVPYFQELLKGTTFNHYFEPFLGGGAVFFGLRPVKATLSDVNEDLINTYVQVKWRPYTLIRELKNMPVNKEYYCNLRVTVPYRKIAKAVRFLYLNRTAFAGMYRLNKQGHFNVPFGGGERTPSRLWDDKLLAKASQALKNAKIVCQDFESAIRGARSGDLVYCDPTYTVTHNNNGFIRYNENNFSWSDQERLAHVAREMVGEGVTIIVSNAFHHEIRDLYSTAETHVLERMSSLCPDTNKRRITNEYLFVLRPKTKSIRRKSAQRSHAGLLTR